MITIILTDGTELQYDKCSYLQDDDGTIQVITKEFHTVCSLKKSEWKSVINHTDVETIKPVDTSHYEGVKFEAPDYDHTEPDIIEEAPYNNVIFQTPDNGFRCSDIALAAFIKDRIVSYIKSHPDRKHTRASLSDNLGVDSLDMRKYISELENDNKIEWHPQQRLIIKTDKTVKQSILQLFKDHPGIIYRVSEIQQQLNWIMHDVDIKKIILDLKNEGYVVCVSAPDQIPSYKWRSHA